MCMSIIEVYVNTPPYKPLNTHYKPPSPFPFPTKNTLNGIRGMGSTKVASAERSIRLPASSETIPPSVCNSRSFLNVILGHLEDLNLVDGNVLEGKMAEQDFSISLPMESGMSLETTSFNSQGWLHGQWFRTCAYGWHGFERFERNKSSWLASGDAWWKQCRRDGWGNRQQSWRQCDIQSRIAIS